MDYELNNWLTDQKVIFPDGHTETIRVYIDRSPMADVGTVKYRGRLRTVERTTNNRWRMLALDEENRGFRQMAQARGMRLNEPGDGQSRIDALTGYIQDPEDDRG